MAVMPAIRLAARLLPAILALWLGAGTSNAAQAAYPDHPIKIVAPFPAGAPGSEPQTMARLIELGNDDNVVTGAALGRRLANDKALFAEIVEKAGIAPQ
jgi:hypothetical protein